MTALPPVRKPLIRSALVFLLAAGGAAWGQVRQRPAAPPRFYNRQPARPQPQYRPQPQAQQPYHQPAPIVRPNEQPAAQRPGGTPLVDPGHPGQMAQHLGPWMQAHGNLSAAQQHQALENEPGFHSLQPAEQERLHNQLTHLNNMPPAQRQMRLQQSEAMERLSPPQRQQVRNTLGQLGSIPEYRQAAVRRAYQQLRDLPPGQSQAILNSPQYRSQFNDSERATIGSMVNAAPLLRGFEAPAQVPHD